MLRKDYADYRWAMTQLFAEVDPVGLICDDGAPIDEYEPEINALLKHRSQVSPAQIQEVFAAMLGDDLGDVSADNAAKLADGIEKIRRRLGYDIL